MQEQNNPPDPPVVEPPGEEILAAAMISLHSVIRPRLQAAGLIRWADDVRGDVVLSALKSWHSFDPEIGALQSWINRIAHNRSMDLIKNETRRNGDLLAEYPDEGYSVEERLAHAATRVWDGTAEIEDVAVQVAEKEAINSWLNPVLRATSAVMDTTAFLHGVDAHTRFDGDTAAAAEAFGVSEARVRDHKRSLELHAQVIVKASRKRNQLDTSPVRERDLIECLPGLGEAGSWTRDTAKAIAAYPGPAVDVPVEHVVAHTGWGYNTARQYLATTRRFMGIAYGVIIGPKDRRLDRATTSETD